MVTVAESKKSAQNCLANLKHHMIATATTKKKKKTIGGKLSSGDFPFSQSEIEDLLAHATQTVLFRETTKEWRDNEPTRFMDMRIYVYLYCMQGARLCDNPPHIPHRVECPFCVWTEEDSILLPPRCKNAIKRRPTRDADIQNIHPLDMDLIHELCVKVCEWVLETMSLKISIDDLPWPKDSLVLSDDLLIQEYNYGVDVMKSSTSTFGVATTSAAPPPSSSSSPHHHRRRPTTTITPHPMAVTTPACFQPPSQAPTTSSKKMMSASWLLKQPTTSHKMRRPQTMASYLTFHPKNKS